MLIQAASDPVGLRGQDDDVALVVGSAQVESVSLVAASLVVVLDVLIQDSPEVLPSGHEHADGVFVSGGMSARCRSGGSVERP